MSSFYAPPGDDGLWLYAERGLMAFLFHDILPRDPDFVLDRARNLGGVSLAQKLGRGRRCRFLTEFDLGKKDGFGCPDGGILVGPGEDDSCFVFVEGKQGCCEAAFSPPQTWGWVQDRLTRPNGRQEVRNKIGGFNSQINGQLELRWRFVNALRASPGGGLVSEQHVTLADEVKGNDVFYLRTLFNPSGLRGEDWRRVNMVGGLQPLYDSLRAARLFVLLAVTDDPQVPWRWLQQVRLFDRLGQPVPDASEHVFWMPMSEVEGRLLKV